MWSIWDKTSDLNGFSAESWFESFKHLRGEEIIYIKTVNGRVVQIEGKGILANRYGIDPTLPDEEFIAEYGRVLAEQELAAQEALLAAQEAEETDNAEE